MATKPTKQRTLHDHLSRLNLKRVEKLLGPDAKSLLSDCRRFPINIPEQVKLTRNRLQVRFPSVINDKRNAVITISLSEHKRKRLKIDCTPCPPSDTLTAAVLGLVLENKLELGLSIPPGEEPPWELLDDEALTLYAITQRELRAKDERMKIESHDSNTPWADYSIFNYQSGKTYHSALRSFAPGDAYCSCQDFKVNLLGTCKHLIKLQAHIRRKFNKAALEIPHIQKEFAVALSYEIELTPRLLRPAAPDIPKKLASKLQAYDALTNKAAPDMVRRLLDLARELEAAGQSVHIYPDAERWIEGQLIRSNLELKTALIRKNPEGHPLRTQLLNAELLPYQLDGIAFAAGACRAILADDMGLGKTIQGIGLAALLKMEANIQKVLVICPASLKSQWQAEITKFSDLDSTQILGNADQRAEQYTNTKFFTICNYEQVMRDILHVESQKWDLIILDEGQRIKNWEAKTSRVIKGLRSPFALVLSGTPLENRLDELYSVIEFIDDRRLGPAYRFFSKHRVVNEDGKVTGFRKLDELRTHIQPILLRRTRDGVLGELPPRRTQFIRIPPTQEQLDLHAANMQIVASITRKSYLTEMDFMRLQKALLMCRMAANSTTLVDKQRPGYSSKLEKIGELIEQLSAEPGRKVVLFSEWTQMLDLIEEKLNACKTGFVRLDGKVPQKKRQQIVKTFQTDPDCRFIIMTNAGSTGLNLQAADTVINVDLPWNPAILEQRIARAHRMGQKRPVQVYILVTDETIEENLLGTLSAKKELASAAIDMDSELSEVTMESGVEELKRRLEILLGADDDAPIDESQRAEEVTERAARKERLALSGGQLFSAAFAFLESALPAPSEKDTAAHVTLSRQFAEGLEQCTERDAEGRPSLRITLPDDASLQALAAGFAKFAALAGAGKIPDDS